MMLNAERLFDEGSDKGRYARLPQRQLMLRPQALVVQHMGNHPR